MLIETGKLEEAERLLRQAHERLLTRFGPEHPEVAASWQQLGHLAWEQGRAVQAQDAFQRSLQLRRRSNELALHAGVLSDLAETRIALGQPDSAEFLARECQQLGLDAPDGLAARADLLLAEVAMARDNADAARALHTAATQRLLAIGAEPASAALRPVDFARARLALREDELAEAQRLVDDLRRRLTGRGLEQDPWTWRLDALQAGLDCRAGRAGDGRTRLGVVLAEASSRPSARNARPMMAPRWPCSVRSSWPACASQNLIVGPPPVARSLPSGV